MKEKLIKMLSSVLVFGFNPFGGFLIIACIGTGYWYLSFVVAALMVLSLKFYFYAYRNDIPEDPEDKNIYDPYN